MMKSEEIIAKYPDLNGKIEMLWHSEYWDGPLTGYVTLNDKKGYWVKCIEDFYDPQPEKITAECAKCKDNPGDGTCCFGMEYSRFFVVYALTKEQEQLHLDRHALFVKHVGSHTNYTNGKRSKSGVKPEREWKKFYNTKSEIPEFEKDQIVGWTTSIFTSK